MIKKYYKLLQSIVTIILSVGVFSCDSGDIYPQEYIHDSGVSVNASFSFSGIDAFPNNYLMVFGAFVEGRSVPVSFIEIRKPTNNDPIDVNIEKLPENVTSIRLCLTNSVRQPIYTLFEKSVTNPNNDIYIDEDINILSYNKVIQKIFDRQCTSCHGGGGSGAGHLLLSSSVSYDELLYEMANKDNNLYRVVPRDVSQSFLITALTNDDALNTPHKSKLPHPDDLILLKEWINSGAIKD